MEPTVEPPVKAIPEAKPGAKPLNIAEYEELARYSLARQAYDYYAGFSWDGITVRENRDAYSRIALRPRMLVDVSERNKEVELFGTRMSMPMIIAPMAFQAMAHSGGELEMAAAAESTGIVMALSTLANFSIEQISQSTKANLWFQLYVYKDRGLTKSLINRAESAGCKALVVTVDSPFIGQRENDVRNKFRLPPGLCLGNLAGTSLDQLPENVDDSALAAYVASLYDPTVTWKDIAWFRSLTKLPVLVKGILRADDAKMALDHGVSGIVVSNHGGRQLDTAIATINALPEIVQAVGGKCKILVDGGIRRGTDVLKAVALGADAVMVGRPLIWGLAYDGRHGAQHVLDILNAELDLAMALCGCSSLKSVTADLVRL